ncbi:hypothetical protein SynA15127_01046 [Synechococcus sp. A15-127]|nr:hypothetical protein SynA15127_01046 [Synechococcus sp. A15-127]
MISEKNLSVGRCVDWGVPVTVSGVTTNRWPDALQDIS